MSRKWFFLLISISLAWISCDLLVVEDTSTYVRYRDNGADGGSLEVDQLGVQFNTTVEVAEPGTLRKTNHVFDGWNTSRDGSGDAYDPGDELEIGVNPVILWAQWLSLVNSVVYDGNGNDGGSVPDDPEEYAEGDTVTVLGPGDLSLTDFTFDGWNTEASGTGTSYLENDSFTMGTEEITLYAQWSGGTASPLIGTWSTSAADPMDPSTTVTEAAQFTSTTLTRTTIQDDGATTTTAGVRYGMVVSGSDLTLTENQRYFPAESIGVYNLFYALNGSTSTFDVTPEQWVDWDEYFPEVVEFMMESRSMTQLDAENEMNSDRNTTGTASVSGTTLTLNVITPEGPDGGTYERVP